MNRLSFLAALCGGFASLTLPAWSVRAEDPAKLPQVLLKTNKGEILLELYEDEAPNTVANFVSLVEQKFYDGLKFHRVIEGFMAQGGDPTGTGSGREQARRGGQHRGTEAGAARATAGGH
jgi:peptidylprolyl isomerase/peptidyl-prolyl cis-trans isomerase B (cyclophilin B)